MKTKTQLLVGLALLAPVLLIAQTNGVPVMPVPEPAAPWWNGIWEIAAMVIAAIFAWLGKYAVARAKGDAVAAKAWLVMTEATSRTFVNFVRPLKQGGGFTNEKKKEAAQMAKDLAILLAKDPDVRAYILDQGTSLVESVVTKLKGGTKLENKAGT